MRPDTTTICSTGFLDLIAALALILLTGCALTDRALVPCLLACPLA